MLLFDWDDANRNHIALHKVTAQEAQQILRNNPIDLDYDIINHEERFGQIGETDKGRILHIITTFRGPAIRVVTCFEPSKPNLLFYLEEKRKEFM